MKEILDYLKEAKDTTNIILKEIENLNKSANILYNAIYNAREALENPKDSREFRYKIKNSVYESAADLLWEKVEPILIASVEFDSLKFSEPLKECIYKSYTYDVEKKTDDEFNLKIRLDRSAGTIADYADGITYAREVLGIGKGNPISASALWGLIFSAGKLEKTVLKKVGKGKKAKTIDVTEKYKNQYNRTMVLRMKGFGGEAPWWNMLEQGTGIELTSSRGGYPTPSYGANNFIHETEKKISEGIKGKLATYLEEFLNELRNDINRNYKAIVQIKIQIKDLEEVTPEDFKVTVERIRIHLLNYYSDQRISLINKEKLEDLISRVIRGDWIPDRIDLGSRTAGAPRIRTLNIVKEIKRLLKEMDELIG